MLLVDDDEDFVRRIGEQLAGEVRSVRAVRTAREALDLLASAPIDVVVCDLVLGDDDGLALLERIGRSWPSVARVLITGFGDRLDARDTTPGAHAVVSKPCDASSLAALLDAMPRAKSPPPAGEAAPPSGGAPGGARLSCAITRGRGRTRVALSGALDEHADLRPLRARLVGRVVFDLRGIDRINSAGAHHWLDFVRALPAVTELVLVHCSRAFVTQMNLVRGFAGAGRVESFYAPFACPRCLHERLELLRAEPVRAGGAESAASHACPRCGAPMQLDEPPERYLAFCRPERAEGLA